MLGVINLQKSVLAKAVGGAILMAALAPVAANAGERVGALQCKLSGNGLSALVVNQELDCIYQDDISGAPPSHYVGKLTKVGANVSFNGPGEMIWGVAAATNHLGPGALAGDYAGPGTSVKVGVGGGGALLVGGSGNTISLQPLELEAGSGLGITAGIDSLTLAFVPDRPIPVFRHPRLPR